jgi:S-layer protein (TIGR01564 family)
MNHVLVGGPVANSLVASLVTAGKSKVTWETSDGDIEVVSGHPAEGFNGIIVAGKTRTETEAAAKALADAL